MDLVRRDRRSLEHGKSGVREYGLVPLTGRPVFPRHVAVVGRRSAPGEAIAFVVRTRAMKAVAARQFSFEVIDI